MHSFSRNCVNTVIFLLYNCASYCVHMYPIRRPVSYRYVIIILVFFFLYLISLLPTLMMYTKYIEDSCDKSLELEPMFNVLN